MRTLALEYWIGFVAWLGGGVSGVLPFTLQATLGPVWRLLPLARQVADTLGPWLRALLEERQRRAWSLPRTAASPSEQHEVEVDVRVRPLTIAEIQDVIPLLPEMVRAEFARLSRLTGAPTLLFSQPNWLAWEVRYWALVICLARLGQLYFLLERSQGSATARRVWEEAARAWA